MHQKHQEQKTDALNAIEEKHRKEAEKIAKKAEEKKEKVKEQEKKAKEKEAAKKEAADKEKEDKQVKREPTKYQQDYAKLLLRIKKSWC